MVDAAEAASTAAAALVERQERELAALLGAGRDRPVAELQAAFDELRGGRRGDRRARRRGCRRPARRWPTLLAARGRRGRGAGRRPGGAAGPHGRVARRRGRRSTELDRAARRGPGRRRRPAGRGSPGSPTRPSAARRSSPPRPTSCAPGRPPTPPASPPRSARPTAGFADVLEAAAALLDAGRLAALDRRIDEHDRRARRSRRRPSPTPSSPTSPPRPDLDALEERCAAATRQREEAVAELDRARRCAGGAGRAGRRGDRAAGRARPSCAAGPTRSARWPTWSTAAAPTRCGCGCSPSSSPPGSSRSPRWPAAGCRTCPAAATRSCTATRRAGTGPAGGLGLDVLDEYTGCLRADQDPLRRRELHGLPGARARPGRRRHRGDRRRADRHPVRRRGVRHARRRRRSTR